MSGAAMRMIVVHAIFWGGFLFIVVHYSFWAAFSIFLMGWMLAITLTAFTVKN
jgi:hypothetical protein